MINDSLVIVSTYTKVGNLPRPKSGFVYRGLISLVAGFGKNDVELRPDDHKPDSLGLISLGLPKELKPPKDDLLAGFVQKSSPFLPYPRLLNLEPRPDLLSPLINSLLDKFKFSSELFKFSIPLKRSYEFSFTLLFKELELENPAKKAARNIPRTILFAQFLCYLALN